MYAGWEPTSTLQVKADTFKVAARSSADTGGLKTVKPFLGKILVLRSDLHVYTLCTHTFNPQLQWDVSIACSCKLRRCAVSHC